MILVGATFFAVSFKLKEISAKDFQVGSSAWLVGGEVWQGYSRRIQHYEYWHIDVVMNYFRWTHPRQFKAKGQSCTWVHAIIYIYISELALVCNIWGLISRFLGGKDGDLWILEKTQVHSTVKKHLGISFEVFFLKKWGYSPIPHPPPSSASRVYTV